MLMRRNTSPVDYRMCRQTVTVYHRDGEEYTRTVHNRAFLDFRKNHTVDKTGSKESNSFLLIIPGDTQTVFVEDKVLLGEGPEITCREEWAALNPTTTPGLVVVKYVDPKYWGTQMVHVEAGG
ncbi:MAG: hypothetical protein J6C98_09675 [Oscillospiraceae bacterium]|nr:hypothetical protein [Oscillospiraceae bacterium]